MNVFSRYLIRHLFLGFAAAAGLLLPLFTTFNLINELDDVSPGGYRWTQAVLVVLMTLPRTLVELSPFIALLGGIVGLGQLSKNSELTAIRSMGFSIFRIALVALVAGILWTVSLGAIDEWVASPLQQQALQIKSTATALGEDDDITGNMLWARRGNEFVTVKSLNEQGQPVGVEIFHYRDDLSLESYIYARSATIEDDKTWILHGVNHKKWLNGKETLETLDNLAWQSAFTSMDLEELSMPGNTFSVRQLNHYIHYLQETRLNVVLRGIAFGARPGAVIEEGGKQQVYLQGETLGSHNAVIEEINRDHVMLRYQGKIEHLSLAEEERSTVAVTNKKAVSDEAKQAVAEPAVSVPVEIPAAVRQALAKDPQKIFNYIQLTPVRKEGIVGYAAKPGADRSLFDASGFKEGDIAIALNQQDFTDPRAMIALMRQLPSMDSIQLTVLRKGARHDISIALR
ncbi:type II secretion system protein GspC [Escherichia coli]|nr:type II secretion system protein GspC [Escherichia coli]ELR9323651.1 type II secretion system protein GspC [Escherichia coli]NZA06448.1 type II secretion system protein GspC [Escherichia coli]NZD16700.1 type II secretion system protein GspC [Escherichia coli]